MYPVIKLHALNIRKVTAYFVPCRRAHVAIRAWAAPISALPWFCVTPPVGTSHYGGQQAAVQYSAHDQAQGVYDNTQHQGQWQGQEYDNAQFYQ